MPFSKDLFNTDLSRGNVLVGNRGGRTLVTNVADHITGQGAAETEHGVLLLDPEGISTVLWSSEEERPETNTLPTAIGPPTEILPSPVPQFAHVPSPPDAWEIGEAQTETGPAPAGEQAVEIDVMAPKPKTSTAPGHPKPVTPATKLGQNRPQTPQGEGTEANKLIIRRKKEIAEAQAAANKDDSGKPTQAIDGTWRWPADEPSPEVGPSEDLIRERDAVPFEPCFQVGCTVPCSFCGAQCGTGCPYDPEMNEDVCCHDGSNSPFDQDAQPSNVSALFDNPEAY